MIETPYVMTAIVLFGLSTLSSLSATFVVFAMIGEVNRKRDARSQISYLHCSWLRVFREYRSLYPQGTYTRYLVLAVILTCVLFPISVYLLFGLIPRHALPSR
jgi:hypothetical protein